MGMDSSSAQHHHQEMNCSSQTLESMLMCTKPQQHQENKKPRPADMDSLKCPRCESTNTKFCYYNNYSLSQPRYFCKSCRRYWTKGGTLRNVPVGGGCRKNKRSSTSSSSACSSASSKQRSPIIMSSNPLPSYDSNDLSLAIARLQRQGQDYDNDHNPDFSIWGNPNMPHGFLENPTNGIENFHYGNLGLMGMGMGNQFEEVKQEMFGGVREGESSKVLFGFPWHNGGGNSNSNSMGEFDSGRSLSWNGIGSGASNWHGLLNSPLL